MKKHIDLWGTRTTSSGRFDEAKKRGDVLSGARREDGGFWDAFDSLHKSLLFLVAVATVGLVLHAFGVFV